MVPTASATYAQTAADPRILDWTGQIWIECSNFCCGDGVVQSKYELTALKEANSGEKNLTIIKLSTRFQQLHLGHRDQSKSSTTERAEEPL